MTQKIIAFQGEAGSYSDIACRGVFADASTLACDTFEAAFSAVREGKADLAMIPVDNTLAGRVADVHHLIPSGDLFIIGEHFQPIRHCLLALKGANPKDLRHVHSHIHALPQCKGAIKRLGLLPSVHVDTAGAARQVAQQGDPAHSAIASELAAEIYGLDIVERDIQDTKNNITRFLILSTEPLIPDVSEGGDVITTLLFETRNIPASLYKALGGFATNGMSIAKLESYVGENFKAAQFYCDIEAHSDSPEFQNAIEELGFFADNVKFMGTYPSSKFRK